MSEPNKVAVVTGAGTGIGRASALALLAAGYRVVLAGRRQEALDIACGQVDVGNAMTELSQRMAKGVRQANGSIEVEPMMDVSEVASTVAYMSGLPLGTNIQFVTVMATNMPFVGRG